MRDTNQKTASSAPLITNPQATLIENYLAGRKPQRCKAPSPRKKYRARLPQSDETHEAVTVASKEKCGKCGGSGVRLVYKKHSIVCDCVYRSCFRKSVDRHRLNRLDFTGMCRCNFERSTVGSRVYGYRNIEFGIDLNLTAKRVLEPLHYFIFTKYHMAGRHWHSVCDKIGMERGNFFHAVYAIESSVGKALMETNMFPPQKYFGSPSLRDQNPVSATYHKLEVMKELGVRRDTRWFQQQ